MQRHFASSPLHKAPAVVHNFDGNTIHGISGIFLASATHKRRTCIVYLVVMPVSLHAVIGSDTIQALGLVIDGAILQVYCTPLQQHS